MKIALDMEYKFRLLWYITAFAFGDMAYFALPQEPNWIFCLILGMIAIFLIYKLRSVWLKLLLFFILGLTVVCVRTHFVNTEFMWKTQWNKIVSGRVDDSFLTYKGQIVVLDQVAIEKAKFVPKRIRVYFNSSQPLLKKGDSITFQGNLYSPQNYQQQRFFYQGWAASGYVNHLLKHDKGTPNLLDKIRQNIIQRLKTQLSPSQAEIAIPLIVGEQQMVSPELYTIYRKAGIAHVLSVSGFHMALLAGFVFFVIRGLLSLIPYVVVRLPVKKVAAIVAFFITLFYLFLSGVQVPALRSFLMIAIVFLGIIFDRKTFSLYTLFLVGFCLLLWHPEWIVSVSFQLSFMAVMVLVGVFEDIGKRWSRIRLVELISASCVANVLITLALSPFVIYHFNQFNPYGVVGNLLTSILFSFLVMPMLFVATLLMPFHGEFYFLKCAGFVLDQITSVSTMISKWPYAEVICPSFNAIGLAFVALGLVVLCVIKNKRRWFGILVCLCGWGVGYLMTSRPDMIVLNRGKTVIVRQQDKFLLKGKTDWLVDRFVRQQGQSEVVPLKEGFVLLKDYKVAFTNKNCAEADLAILSKTKHCAAKEILVPKYQEDYYVFLEDKIHFQQLDWLDVNRPWNIHFQRKGKIK